MFLRSFNLNARSRYARGESRSVILTSCLTRHMAPKKFSVESRSAGSYRAHGFPHSTLPFSIFSAPKHFPRDGAATYFTGNSMDLNFLWPLSARKKNPPQERAAPLPARSPRKRIRRQFRREEGWRDGGAQGKDGRRTRGARGRLCDRVDKSVGKRFV